MTPIVITRKDDKSSGLIAFRMRMYKSKIDFDTSALDINVGKTKKVKVGFRGR